MVSPPTKWLNTNDKSFTRLHAAIDKQWRMGKNPDQDDFNLLQHWVVGETQRISDAVSVLPELVGKADMAELAIGNLQDAVVRLEETEKERSSDMQKVMAGAHAAEIKVGHLIERVRRVKDELASSRDCRDREEQSPPPYQDVSAVVLERLNAVTIPLETTHTRLAERIDTLERQFASRDHEPHPEPAAISPALKEMMRNLVVSAIAEQVQAQVERECQRAEAVHRANTDKLHAQLAVAAARQEQAERHMAETSMQAESTATRMAELEGKVEDLRRELENLRTAKLPPVSSMAPTDPDCNNASHASNPSTKRDRQACVAGRAVVQEVLQSFGRPLHPASASRKSIDNTFDGIVDDAMLDLHHAADTGLARSRIGCGVSSSSLVGMKGSLVQGELPVDTTVDTKKDGAETAIEITLQPPASASRYGAISLTPQPTGSAPSVITSDADVDACFADLARVLSKPIRERCSRMDEVIGEAERRFEALLADGKRGRVASLVANGLRQSVFSDATNDSSPLSSPSPLSAPAESASVPSLAHLADSILHLDVAPDRRSRKPGPRHKASSSEPSSSAIGPAPATSRPAPPNSGPSTDTMKAANARFSAIESCVSTLQVQFSAAKSIACNAEAKIKQAKVELRAVHDVGVGALESRMLVVEKDKKGVAERIERVEAGSMKLATHVGKSVKALEGMQGKMQEMDAKVNRLAMMANSQNGRLGPVKEQAKDALQAYAGDTALKRELEELSKDVKAMRIRLEAEIRLQAAKQEALEDRLAALERVQDRQVREPVVYAPATTPLRSAAASEVDTGRYRERKSPTKRSKARRPLQDEEGRQQRIEHLDGLMRRVAEQAALARSSGGGGSKRDDVVRLGKSEEDGSIAQAKLGVQADKGEQSLEGIPAKTLDAVKAPHDGDADGDTRDEDDQPSSRPVDMQHLASRVNRWRLTYEDIASPIPHRLRPATSAAISPAGSGGNSSATHVDSPASSLEAANRARQALEAGLITSRGSTPGSFAATFPLPATPAHSAIPAPSAASTSRVVPFAERYEADIVPPSTTPHLFAAPAIVQSALTKEAQYASNRSANQAQTTGPALPTVASISNAQQYRDSVSSTTSNSSTSSEDSLRGLVRKVSQGLLDPATAGHAPLTPNPDQRDEAAEQGRSAHPALCTTRHQGLELAVDFKNGSPDMDVDVGAGPPRASRLEDGRITLGAKSSPLHSTFLHALPADLRESLIPLKRDSGTAQHAQWACVDTRAANDGGRAGRSSDAFVTFPAAADGEVNTTTLPRCDGQGSSPFRDNEYANGEKAWMPGGWSSE